MTPYKTKAKKLSGKRYAEVRAKAYRIFREIQRRTRRQPYIRSSYFNKQKVFLNYFWPHLFQKHPNERMKRLRYFAAAVELIRYSRQAPITKPNPNNPAELVHRFTGVTREGETFYVQIKENIRTDRKYFMSCFPDRVYR